MFNDTTEVMIYEFRGLFMLLVIQSSNLLGLIKFFW